MATKRKKTPKTVWWWVAGVAMVVLVVALIIRGGVSRGWGSQNIVVVDGQKVKWVSLNQERVVVFELPEEMLVEVVGTKGELRSSVLWKFGQGEGRPIEIVRRSVESLFGAVADGVVYVPTDDWWGLLAAKSNLPFTLRWWFFYRWRGAEPAVESIPTRLGVVEKLPDGSQVLRVDKQRLELVLDDYLTEETVLRSSARLKVINASSWGGAGRLAERQIKTVGGLVAELVASEKRPGWCYFSRGKGEENRGLAEWLKERLGCRQEKGDSWVVTLGEDWGRAYSR